MLKELIWKEIRDMLRSWRMLAYLIIVSFFFCINLISFYQQFEFYNLISDPFGHFSSLNFIITLLLIVCAITFTIDSVSREFDENTASLLLSSPVKRYKILIAKLIPAILMWLATILIFTFGEIFVAISIGSIYLRFWLLIALLTTITFFALIPFFLLISILVKNLVGSIGAGIGFFFLFYLSVPFNLPIIKEINPIYQYSILFYDGMDGHIDNYIVIIILILFGILFSFASVEMFKRAEVKK